MSDSLHEKPNTRPNCVQCNGRNAALVWHVGHLSVGRRAIVLTHLALLAFITIAPGVARAANPWFSIRRELVFADVDAQLQVLVDEHARQRTSRFCVVGETVGRVREAWVYWPAAGKLILWRPDRDNPHAIAGSNRYLDLKKDVVAGDDVGGSTYKLTRTQAAKTIKACTQHGDHYTIAKQIRTGAHG
jgi:hypothetical protein